MSKSKKSLKAEETDPADFFETMPMTAGHFVYRDDAMGALNEKDSISIEDEIKTTAIITLVLVLVTAIALGLLIWRGLDTIKGTTTPTANSSSLEL